MVQDPAKAERRGYGGQDVLARFDETDLRAELARLGFDEDQANAAIVLAHLRQFAKSPEERGDAAGPSAS
jgi:hypothetical protein